MNPLIRHAKHSDLTELVELLCQCADAMSQTGMHHWQNVYDKASVTKNLQSKQVYVMEQQGQLLGCVALGTESADYYQDCWPQAPVADFYLTQLAVHPDYQGQGLGQQLVKYCISQVRPASLQLDAVDHYPALNQFYSKLGFEVIATGIGLGDKRHLYIYRG